jgi:hypothetical protein
VPITFVPTARHQYSIGDRKEVIFDIAYSGTPTVGGDALTAAALGFTQMDTVDVVGVGANAGATAAYAIGVIHPNAAFVSQVLIAFLVQAVAATTSPLVAATGALTAGSFRARVVGKGSQSGVVS